MQYKLVPPDGGWGYLITISLSVMNFVTLIPGVAFGLLYGTFLASIGDEISGTALSNGVFNTVQSFTGLVAYYLLQKYSYRKVGLIGAVLYFAGSASTVFVKTLADVIITYGTLEGLGYGLMLPASLSAFNSYFDKKLNFMMGISQTIVAVGAMICPPLVAFLVEYLGFKGALALYAVVALLNFPAMGALQPVELHMKKVAIEEPLNNDKLSALPRVPVQKAKSLCEEVLKAQIEPLIIKKLEEGGSVNSVNFNGYKIRNSETVLHPRLSVVSLGDRASSLIAISRKNDGDKEANFSWFDQTLLKDPKYLNICCGLSLSFTSDLAFYSIVPMLLHQKGFTTTDTALMMMVYYGLDLVSRITISAVSAVYKMRNRYVFLAGSALSAVFRTVFVLNDTYIWTMATLAALGFLRGLIQTPLALVISEEYGDNFTKAFSLFMAVCGCISLLFGPLMSFVKSLTQSDAMVVHLLSVAFLLCSISWTVELLWTKFKGKRTI